MLFHFFFLSCDQSQLCFARPCENLLPYPEFVKGRIHWKTQESYRDIQDSCWSTVWKTLSSRMNTRKKIETDVSNSFWQYLRRVNGRKKNCLSRQTRIAVVVWCAIIISFLIYLNSAEGFEFKLRFEIVYYISFISVLISLIFPLKK